MVRYEITASSKSIIITTTLFLSLIGHTLRAQSNIDFKKFPFDTVLLQKLSIKKDTIMPKFIEGKFYYINIKTNKKINEIAFDVAYPFNNYNFTLIKIDNKFGIIDRNVDFKLKPIYSHAFFDNNYPPYRALISFSKFGAGFDLETGLSIGSPYLEPSTRIIRKIVTFIGKNKKYGIKELDSIDNSDNYKKQKIIYPAIFDTVYFIGFDHIIANKNGKIGLINILRKNFISYRYEESIFDYEDYIMGINYPVNQFGFLRKKKWEYYDSEKEKPTVILTSKHKCFSLGKIEVKNGLGIFKEKEKYNILFNDGSTLPISYDYISENGTVAIQNNKIYLLGEDGIPYLYYSSMK